MKQIRNFYSGCISTMQRYSIRYLTLLVVLLTGTLAYAQADRISISGVLLDSEGVSIIGGSILEQGTTNGTISDIDGNFNLSVSPKAKLEISYIGYTTQIVPVSGKQNFKITLIEDDLVLDEVVVTALGIKRESKALGYAMTEVKADELDANAINPVTALQGKAAGVHISGSDGGMFGSTKIQIRGASTLGNNNQPIYVVDGVILDNTVHDNEVDFATDSGDYGNELKNLNSNDFESVSILRGAAATALYGSRGLNGAIVITTKGGGKQKGFGVSVNQSFGFEAVNTLPKFQTDFGQGPWAASSATRRENPWNTNHHQIDEQGRQTVMNGGNYWGPRYDGSDVVGYDGDIMPYSANKNYYKDMFSTGVSSNTNIVIQGGDGKTSFYNSLGYNFAKGVVKNNEFERLSNMLKASHQISDRVAINASFTFALSKPKNPQLSLGENTITSSLGPLYNTNYYRGRYKGDNHTGMANTNYGDKYGNVPNKGMWWNMYENSETRKETSIRPTLDLTVDILDWLDFKAEANMNYYFTSGERKQKGTGYMNAGVGNGEGGQYSMDQRERKQHTVAGSFLFDKAISDFTIGGFLRGEFYNSSSKFLSAKTDGGLVVPGQYFLGNSKNPLETEGRYEDSKRMLSIIASASFSWKSQLYLDVTGRNDWSSAMIKADGTGNHSFFYPSVSGAWIFTETFANEFPNWFTFGKLRASWAQVGNDTDAYSLITGYNVSSVLQDDGGYLHSQMIPDRLIQDNIKPEKKTSWEVGTDLRFFSDRLSLDFAYYKENTRNQIMTIDKPYASGISSYLINAGDIQNQGVELAISGVPIRTKDWEWKMNMTYTKNKNKIKSLHESAGEYIRLAGYPNEYNFRIASAAQVGGEHGSLISDALPAVDKKGRKIMRYSEGARVGYYQRANEVQDIGVSINPDFLGSVGTGLSWKGLSLNVLLDFRYGGYIASYSNKYAMAYGLHENSLEGRDTATGGLTYVSVHDGKTYDDGIIPDGVFAENSMTTIPGTNDKIDLGGMTYAEAIEGGYIDPAHASTFHRYKGDWGLGVVDNTWFHKVKYIALREISLNYRVPQSIASKLGARGLRLGFSARNLGYLYNSLPNNLNPESVRGTASAEFRERGFSPNRGSYTFSVGIDF